MSAPFVSPSSAHTRIASLLPETQTATQDNDGGEKHKPSPASEVRANTATILSHGNGGESSSRRSKNDQEQEGYCVDKSTHTALMNASGLEVGEITLGSEAVDRQVSKRLAITCRSNEVDQLAYAFDNAFQEIGPGSAHIDSVEATNSSTRHPIQLLTIPPEIRNQIWRSVLTKNDDIKICFSPLAQKHPEYHRGYNFLRRRSSEGLSLGPHAISLLLVCRQTYQEAVGFLYGENRFVSFNIRGLQQLFVNDPLHGIGRTNARMIQRVCLGVPKLLKEEPAMSVHLPAFLDFTCNTLTGLRHAQLMIKYEVQPRTPATPVHRRLWRLERRGLLNAVAWLTKSHSTLKRAVWSASSYGNVITCPRYASCVVTFTVDITTAVKGVRPPIKHDKGLNEEGFAMETKDIVLNCPKIRETSWVDLLSLDETKFGLPDNVDSSERLT